MSIPKIIHYCWFGRGEMPPLAKKCIASWKKYLPDYEIREWNEDNFDVNEIAYTREAYAAKKYAFVSDYARFKILYEHGGVYFDTDVEVLKPMDEILARGAFMGLERDVSAGTPDAGNCVNPGLGLACAPGLGLACAPGLGLYKDVIHLYKALHFEISSGVYNCKTVVLYVSEILLKNGLIPHPGIMNFSGISIYPKEYFNPMDYESGHLTITEKTYSIHHYAASWCSKTDHVRTWIRRHLGFYAFLLALVLTQNPLKSFRSIAKKLKIVK